MGRPLKASSNKYRERLAKKRTLKNVCRKHLRDNVRVLRDKRWSYAAIAQFLNERGEKISASSVRRQCMRKENLHEKSYAPTSVPLYMHERVRKLIDVLYDKNSHRTTAQVVKLIEEEFGIKVSTGVVSVWREELGYRVMRARYGFAVRLINRAIRLAYAIEKLRVNEQFMMHVFSDEMVVQLDKNSKSVWVQSRAAAVQPAPKFPVKILIFGCISWRGPSKIIILAGHTTVDSVLYQDMCQAALVPLMRDTFGGSAIYVQDSAPAHVSNTTKRFLRNKGIQCEEWPPETPDANPIELIWAIMKRWLINECRPSNQQELIDGAKFWWKHRCTVELCQKVISGVPRALKRIVAANGGPVHN